MSLTAIVGPELPYLRRYARAITGSQQLGDAAVRETLEALLEAPTEFDVEQPPRLELYRVFHHLWRSDAVSALSSDGPISRLTPRSRQALLLVAVEGFSVDQVAEILESAPDDIAAEMDTARAAIAEQLRSDVLIIEDEAIIALHIQSIVKELGHNVVGVARTHREAVEIARRENPELVLADISLGDADHADRDNCASASRPPRTIGEGGRGLIIADLRKTYIRASICGIGIKAKQTELSATP
jgi:DNA-directed RNA polymerase specialized sigma24 family protein